MKKKADGSILFVCLYVDDLIFIGNNPTMFEDFKKSMLHEFEMTNIDLMTHFLGLEVSRPESRVRDQQRRSGVERTPHLR
jgi:hypothetical protein